MATLRVLLSRWREINAIEVEKSASLRTYLDLIEKAGTSAQTAILKIQETESPARFKYAKYVLERVLTDLQEPLPVLTPTPEPSSDAIKSLVLTVGPGDWNRVVFPMDGTLAVFNRSIDEVRCKAMARDWHPEHAGPLALIQRPAGGYYIVDGQHRLFTATQLVKTQSEFLARIYAPTSQEEVKNLIVQLNKSTALRLSHLTTIGKQFSWWPEIFASHTLYPQESNRRGRMTWPAILTAHTAVQNGELRFQSGTKHDGADLYMTSDPLERPKIESTAADIAAWRSFWEPASTDRSWVTSASALMFMLALRRQNDQHPRLEDVGPRLLKWPGLPRALKSTSNHREVVLELLRGANYRLRDDNLFRINGLTGKEL
jgi:hypothetical protein